MEGRLRFLEALPPLLEVRLLPGLLLLRFATLRRFGRVVDFLRRLATLPRLLPPPETTGGR